MKCRELIRISMDNYRKNGLISHVLFFFLGLLACSFLLIGLLWIDVSLIVIPFIAIPIIFSAMIATNLLREQNYMTLGGFFRCFGTYFSSKFNSTFRVIRSGIISFAIYLGTSIILSLVINLTFYHTNFMNYQAMVDEVLAFKSISAQDLYAIMNKFKDLINITMIYSNVPASFTFALFFIFFTTRNSATLFDRLATMEFDGRINAITQEQIMKRYYKEYNATYFKLNWPIFPLFLLGFAGGAYLGYITLIDYSSVFTMGLVVGLFVVFGLFGPFYLANTETLYMVFKDRYESEREILKGQFTESLEKFIEEMKKREEESKKDSNES